MNLKSRVLVGSILAFVMGAAPIYAASYDPHGAWEADNEETRYDITLCGDGTQLCAVLTWIRPDLRDDRNGAYLNKHVINGARLANPNEWRGDIDIFGNKVSGNIRMLSDKVMRVRGCAFLILCEKYLLIRMDTDSAKAE